MTLWGELGDILIEKKTNHSGLCPVVITSLNVKQYNSKYLDCLVANVTSFPSCVIQSAFADKIFLSSSSSTMLCDNDDIPALMDLKVDMR